MFFYSVVIKSHRKYMKLIARISLTVVLASLVVSAHANDITGKIVELVTWHDGNSVIRLDNGPINGCPSKYYYSLGLKGQDVKADPMLTLALAAYMSNRTVTISSSHGTCQGGEEKLTNIRILPN
jgi:hypothetical protein